MKQKKLRSLSAVLLIGWCLIFLRCETTEKSMVRALYLAQKEQSITVGLLYQAPEAAADASEASGAVQLQLAQADTLAKALAAAQKQLPQKADYRLCDYLLIDQDASEELLAAYERTVLENRQGRVSAKVSVLEMDDGFLEELPAEKQEFPNKLLEQLKQCADQMPRLYQYQDGMLLPQLRAEKQEVALADTSILWRVENSIELGARQAETARLLLEMGGVHTFWLEGEPVTVRRCSVSVTAAAKRRTVRTAGRTVHADGAVFLAAGHRPCASAAAQCIAERCGQRKDHNKKRLPAIAGRREIFTDVIQLAVGKVTVMVVPTST